MAIVAVAPTETVVLSYALGELKATGRVGVQLVNMDATQTFTGGIRRRKYGMSAWAIAADSFFTSIAPMTSELADIDVYDTEELEVFGSMSGAGGDIEVGVSFRARLR